MSDIVDLIDSAVSDWELSPDAVRYNSVEREKKVKEGNLCYGETPIPIDVINNLRDYLVFINIHNLEVTGTYHMPPMITGIDLT